MTAGREMARDEWWRGAVLYQVYPRSFADSDGDGVGDLRGVIDRLDHLNDGTPAALGVDAIWLSPFYPSPLADFGYDISEYQDVDPVYGTLADFDELVAEAHRRGIRVINDLVMNHTSTRHPWFVESSTGRASARRDWYIWADPGPGGVPPNNWLSAFERCGSAWTYDPSSGQYYLHSFTPGQPDLNLRNPAVREALRSVWRFWLDRGVDGFRVDVAHRLLKDAGLRDNPAEIARARRHVVHPTVRQVNMDLPEVHELLKDLRATLDAYPGRFALGEVPVADDGRLVDYFGGTGMHTAFHIAFWDQPWDAAAFRATVDRMAGLVRPGALPTYALATHDIPRAVSRFGDHRRARVAAMMMLTLRGLACVYYGEEIGMSDAPPPSGQELDVDGRDGRRTPMQWDATGRGFTRGHALARVRAHPAAGERRVPDRRPGFAAEPLPQADLVPPGVGRAARRRLPVARLPARHVRLPAWPRHRALADRLEPDRRGGPGAGNGTGTGRAVHLPAARRDGRGRLVIAPVRRRGRHLPSRTGVAACVRN